jgi:uncharacterized protein YbbC (DUF1343 family)
MVSERRKAKLLGIGLDHEDDEVRLTRGKNFELVGGSEDTHASMQEKCTKFNEKLDAKGKALEDLEHGEFLDMAAECRMNVAARRRRED